MGMETLVYFGIDGTTVCGRVNPNAGAREGQLMRLAADLNNMHLIDGQTDAVL
jgi:multiple sugar transport system ATP-binding protein